MLLQIASLDPNGDGILFFEISSIFFVFSRFVFKKLSKFSHYHSQILLNNFGFWDFSIDPRHVQHVKILKLNSRWIEIWPWHAILSRFYGIIILSLFRLLANLGKAHEHMCAVRQRSLS